MRIKKALRLTIIMSLVAGMVMGITGCGTTNFNKLVLQDTDSIRQAEGENKAKTQYSVGLSMGNIQNDFDNIVCEEMQNYGEQRGIAVSAVNAAGSSEKQARDVETLMMSGMSAMIVEPLDDVDTLVENTGMQGKPLFLLNSTSQSDAVIAGSFVDHFSMGAASGQCLLDYYYDESDEGEKDDVVLEGVILELQGPEGNAAYEQRSLGFESVFNSQKGIKIVRSPYCGYDRVTASQVVESILANNNILGIFAVSDDLALGAMDALADLKMKDIPICSVDGKMEAVKAVDSGNILCTVTYDPIRYAHSIVNNVIFFLNGDEYDSIILLPYELIDHSNALSYVDESRAFARVRMLEASEDLKEAAPVDTTDAKKATETKENKKTEDNTRLDEDDDDEKAEDR